MSIRDDFFAAKAKGSLWDVAVSIKRGNPLPLDADSIFESYSALEAYAADVLAYPGQVVAVVNADSTGIYYLDQDLAIQPVGVIPVGDEKTIEVSESGAISLLGAAGAPNGTLPMIDSETGKLVWKTLEDIGAGDGNDNTTYEFDFANEKITITPKHNGIAQTAVELDLSAFVTATELVTELAPYAKTTAVEAAQTKANDAYTLAESKVSTVDYEADKVLDKADRDEIRGIAEAAKTKVETFLEGEGVADVIDSLKDIKDELDKMADATDMVDKLALKADKTTVEGIEGRVKAIEDAPYVTKSQLDEVDGKFADYTNTEDLTELLAGKQDVIAENTYDAYGAAAAAIAAAATDASTKADTAKSEAIADAATKYYGKGDLYTKDEIDDLLEGIQGGASESAASVNTKLEAYKKIVNAEVWGDEAGAGDNGNSRIDKAEANITNLDSRVTTAKEQADKGVADAGAAAAAASAAQDKADANEIEIGKHAGRLSTLEEAKTDHLNRIVALEAHDEAHTAEFNTLSGTVTSHGTTIAEWTNTKANTADLNSAVSRIAKNETDIAGINENLAKKADASKLNDYYTKTEIAAITGTLEEDKTLVDMINAAVYDDAAVKKLISDEVARAKAAEQANTDEIARVNGILVDALENNAEGLDSIKELADWINTHGTEASAMAEAIEANADAIAAINHETTGILAVAKEYADSKVSAIPAATVEALGLVRYDGATIMKNDSNQLYVAKVSTDILEQGANTLVLNGGSALE